MLTSRHLRSPHKHKHNQEWRDAHKCLPVQDLHSCVHLHFKAAETNWQAAVVADCSRRWLTMVNTVSVMCCTGKTLYRDHHPQQTCLLLSMKSMFASSSVLQVWFSARMNLSASFCVKFVVLLSYWGLLKFLLVFLLDLLIVSVIHVCTPHHAYIAWLQIAHTSHFFSKANQS